MLKSKKLLSYAIMSVLLINPYSADSCTIFMANDGKQVWIGNNEDGLQQLKYRIWYYPAQGADHGYSIWTELSHGNLLNGLSYLDPQGGLNECGLFMDYTAIAKIAFSRDEHKKDRKKQVVTDLLKKCRSVDEALTWLAKYNLVKLNTAQLFIGDASGDYATVTGGYVVRKKTSNFVLTNYCINDGHQEACYRRDAAINLLSATKTVELGDVKTILERSSQKSPNNLISNYSMAVNLKSGTIYLYYKNDFTTGAVLSLAGELKKGRHHTAIADYFPAGIVPVIEKELGRNGIDSAIHRYVNLRNSSSAAYNFKNDDALDLAINWIEKGKTTEAIQLLECLVSFDPQKTVLYSWLGVAYRKAQFPAESNKNFAKAFENDPQDYVATLFGKQENQTVTLKLPDFEGAERVAVMGDFSGWTKHPIQMKKENGFWTCAITLPKGEVIYKFLVNDQYLADSKNFMHIGTGPEIYSKLYVW